MIEQNKLIEGNIFKALIGLALPIMGTSFVQMAYNMTDMIWIGRVGSKAVAAVGTAGFFTWLAMAFIMIPKIAAEIGVAQSVGKKDNQSIIYYIRHTLQLNVFFALLYGFILILLKKQVIGFFNLQDKAVIEMAQSYLTIVSAGMLFYFINPVLTGILNGYGESRTPFLINGIGLITNMILDPVLIMGIGPFPVMGVKGAALATVIAQVVVTTIFLLNIRRKIPVFSQINFFRVPDWNHIRGITKLGLPVALQSGLFTVIAMVIARIIAQWGPVPVAVQKVGSQIEAISWMTANGFSTALGAFVGQNYGAKKWNRIYKGYFTAMGIMCAIGIAATGFLILGAESIFSIFIPEQEAIAYGIQYLKILGISQLFMCIEITTAGAFNGLSKTVPPSIVGITFNALRIPTALILSSPNLLGLNGIWWSISISSIFKGIVLVTWFGIFLKRQSFRLKETNIGQGVGNNLMN
ncbi:MATE family efflux transporter [Irregularibacter muris]|uniref:Probable multidrug resistance protein NorM n=1 Tax=Irregularibacter muris TaxID=1796619 RepID=A0AAE3KZ30_9FIRM|nr:MATE family efflux transporter [Irregularibacter muris]MCR1897572.1 MATE family efflux transporter [Irregularibacter muris]